MVLTPLKGLLFAAGAVVAGVGAAYVAGAFDPYLNDKPAALVATTPGEDAAAPASGEAAGQKSARLEAPAGAPEAATEPNDAQQAAPGPAAQPTGEPAAQTGSEAEVIAPSFDLVRVEPNGSVVIAGRAAPGATVEIIHGATVLGTATSGPGGDFAAVLEEPLKPGDYQIVLRATTPDNVAATSLETAIVTVPDNEAGQVLALVDRPGAPSRLITVPEAQPVGEGGSEVSAAAPNAPAAGQQPPAETPTPAAPEPVPEPQAAAPQPAPSAPAPQEAPAQPAPAATQEAVPNIEAVEIDGRQVFVAGAARPGATVRVYANEILLGETVTAPNGRFLIEAVRDLPVGDYIVRADMLSSDGSTVVARAAVPFTRAEGEQIAAVAPRADTAEKSGRLPVEPAAPAATPQQQPAADGSAPDAMAAAPAEAAEKLAPVDGSVIIRRGDTLWHISRRVYGRGVRYTTIYLANREQIENPDRIWPGQVFAVPQKTEEGEPADMDAIAPEEPAPAAQ
ncbi:LysM peptidoglycan-binding domain-containing protein [Nitratireductor pacificus]|uniref:Peptidoglycan-binding LysM n=1 Tax=Nitratireductor pacificus pht-3B TaxID=391937 RepID=K2MI04_9HYPH|nr:LysM peptidoglycan-binding domain-containing protein [Nitratireductor pacificus]EKF20360.1 peptidoglycan-binding LysM [Nitratireductor pacificus pht-3B]